MSKILSRMLYTFVFTMVLSWGVVSTAQATLLVVDLKTNYLPGTEFIAARSTLTPGSGLIATKAIFTTDPVDDPGIRLTEYDDLSNGNYTLVVDLLRPDGSVLDSRTVLISLTTNLAVTALIARQGEPPAECEEELQVVTADLIDTQIELESTQTDLSEVQGLLQVANQQLATFQSDDDGDGVIAILDQCPDTQEGSEADALGCSQDQFCEAMVIESWRDVLPCLAADWKEDDPIFRAKDCTINHGFCVAR